MHVASLHYPNLIKTTSNILLSQSIVNYLTSLPLSSLTSILLYRHNIHPKATPWVRFIVSKILFVFLNESLIGLFGYIGIGIAQQLSFNSSIGRYCCVEWTA